MFLYFSMRGTLEEINFRIKLLEKLENIAGAGRTHNLDPAGHSSLVMHGGGDLVDVSVSLSPRRLAGWVFIRSMEIPERRRDRGLNRSAADEGRTAEWENRIHRQASVSETVARGRFWTCKSAQVEIKYKSSQPCVYDDDD